jgi:NADH-quinone oxidoreductase subunit K
MIPPSWFFALSVAMFVLGVVSFFVKKDLLMQFLSVEVMLNAANLAFLALAKSGGFADAQVVVLFVMTVAAAEAAVGLAIILLVFRKKKSIKTEDLRSLKG